VIAVLLLAAGCSRAEKKEVFQPQENCAYIDGNGSLKWASVEACPEGTFSEEELAAFAKERVGAFNRKLGRGDAAENETGKETLPVAVVSAAVENGTAVLVTEYDKPERLLEFAEEIGDYNVPFTLLQVGSAREFSEELKENACLDTEGKTVENPADSAEKGGKTVIKAEGAGLIRTQDKIKMVSRGCSLVDEYTVQTSEEGVSYIVTIGK
jgi:hypothetical protein